MTSDEFVTKVANIEGYLQNDFNRDILLRGCTRLVSQIANRVREKNILGSGKSYDYSKKTTLVGRSSFTTEGAWNKLFNTAKTTYDFEGLPLKGKTKIKKKYRWVTVGGYYEGVRLIVLEGGYAEIRRLEGRKNKKKNYERTGEMWTGFGIKKEEKAQVTIGGTTPMSQKKINWNSWRDDDNIILPTEKEINEFKKYVETGVKRYINAALGR